MYVLVPIYESLFTTCSNINTNRLSSPVNTCIFLRRRDSYAGLGTIVHGGKQLIQLKEIRFDGTTYPYTTVDPAGV